MKYLLVFLFAVVLFSSSRSQPNQWGKAKNGFQLGLTVSAGIHSFVYDVYIRHTNPKEVTIHPFPELSFYIERGEKTYALTPTESKLMNPPEFRLKLTHHSNAGRYLPKDHELHLGSFIIAYKWKVSPGGCLSEIKVMDQTYVKAQNVFQNGSDKEKELQSNVVQPPYCDQHRRAYKEDLGRAQFLTQLLKHSDGSSIAAACEIASDTTNSNLLRGIAGRYLSDLNSTESRNALYQYCLDPSDPDLEDMLYFLFKTNDLLALTLMDSYYQHPRELVRRQVAGGIGMYRSEIHIPVLLKLLHDPGIFTRKEAAKSLQHFDNAQAREGLYRALRDPDLGVRSQAVYSLRENGDQHSLEYLVMYIETEHPDHVGYIEDAFETAEIISGEKFENDFHKLKLYVVSIKK